MLTDHVTCLSVEGLWLLATSSGSGEFVARKIRAAFLLQAVIVCQGKF
jgi:hypothetical protein